VFTGLHQDRWGTIPISRPRSRLVNRFDPTTANYATVPQPILMHAAIGYPLTRPRHRADPPFITSADPVKWVTGPSPPRPNICEKVPASYNQMTDSHKVKTGRKVARRHPAPSEHLPNPRKEGDRAYHRDNPP